MPDRPGRPEPPTHTRPVWFALSLLAQALALYWPLSMGTSVGVPLADKVVHLVIFAVPAYLGLRWATTRAPVSRATPSRWLATAVVLGLLLHAGLSEVIQGALLTREQSAADAFADILGIALGVAAARLTIPSGNDHR
ncbi:MAG: hypothetical protein CSA58_00680 [Micrococcales bacterium]|nr:MAG: hypothetical protein CSA58_00680 [Micrococcales bacterium]